MVDASSSALIDFELDLAAAHPYLDSSVWRALATPRIALSALRAIKDPHARFFAYCHPMQGVDWDLLDHFDDLLVRLVRYGGFAFFDANGNILRVDAICPRSTTTPRNRLIEFAKRGSPLPYAALRSLAADRRFFPVTIDHFRARGARYFAWILPQETIGGLSSEKYGAFAFVFHDLDQGPSLRNCIFPLLAFSRRETSEDENTT